jgi:hypothetical protein
MAHPCIKQGAQKQMSFRNTCHSERSEEPHTDCARSYGNTPMLQRALKNNCNSERSEESYKSWAR